MSAVIKDMYVAIGPANAVLTIDGQLGVLLEVYAGHIIMKTCSGFVDLSDGGQTFMHTCQNKVGVLPAGTAIIYTSEA